MRGVKFVEHAYKMSNVILIINDNVFQKLITHRQYSNTPESGGLLIGRTDINGNTRIYEITEPMDNDIRERMIFRRKDKKHLTYLSEANERCLYFKGNWHSHPQGTPIPSWVDKMSWKSAIKNSKPGESKYIFFVIVGVTEIKVWCGSMKTFSIEEMKYQIIREDYNEI